MRLFLTRVYLALRKVLKKCGINFVLMIDGESISEDGLHSTNSTFIKDSDLLEAMASANKSTSLSFQITWRAYYFLKFLELSARAEGAVMELGTGKGWMMSLASAWKNGAAFSNRHVYLYDKFTTDAVDPISGKVDFSRGGLEAYSDNLIKTKDGLLSFHTNHVFHFISGWLPESLGNTENFPVSFLHVDLNAAVPSVQCLMQLKTRLSSRGIILLDDYGQPPFRDTKVLVDDWAKSQSLEVLALPTGQGVIFIP